MRKIEDNNNSTLKGAAQENNAAKEMAQGAKNKTKKLGKKLTKNKKFRAFIKKHLFLIIRIALLIFAILIFIGLIIFFTTLPGLIIGKIKAIGRNIIGNLKGFINGDSTTAKISDDDINELAQYIQGMGYDLQGYGFGNIEYTEKSQNQGQNSTATKEVKKVHDNVEGKNYLLSYLAADQNSYTLASTNLVDSFKSALNQLGTGKKSDEKNNSTGMIDIVGHEHGIIFADNNDDYAEIDRDTNQLVVYQKKAYVPLISGIKRVFTGRGSFKWGEIFRYDLETWSTRYGRPQELLLALHLSTMMPDLSYEIASSDDFNTKVQVNMQNINVKYDVIATKDDETLSKDTAYDLFFKNCVNFYDPATNENINSRIMPKIDNLGKDDRDRLVAGLIAAKSKILIGESEGKIAVDENLTKVTIVPSTDSIILDLDYRNGPISGSNWTKEELLDYISISANGSLGIENIKWPYIVAVKKHWFYNDIDFNGEKLTYRMAKKAKKIIDYKVDDDSPLNKENISIKLEAEFEDAGDLGGVLYQVCEPEATGPNDNIVKLFNQEYYMYDGTVATASQIEMKKTLDLYPNAVDYEFGGQSGITIDKDVVDKIKKQKVGFKSEHTNALAAFSILQNMHTEAGDYIYRNLKELVVKLDYFEEDEIKSDLKTLACWPIATKNKNTTWEIDRDKNSFSTIIKCSADEKDVIAPSDATVKKIENGTITLRFNNINDETIELYKYIYKDKDPYTNIKKDALTGLTIKISNINIDANIKEGMTLTRKQKIGTAKSYVDGFAIKLDMFKMDKTKVDDINEFFRQEFNSAYEEIMQAKKDYKYKSTTGIDISSIQNGIYNSTSGANVAGLTEVKISKDEFISKLQEFDDCKFTRAAGEIYDICKKNHINPVWCVVQARRETSINDQSDNNYFGLGAFNGTGTEYSYSGIGNAVQAYCDNINARLRGEYGAKEWSAELKTVDSVHFTGELKTIYDVLSNYPVVDGLTKGNISKYREQVRHVVGYVDDCKEFSNMFGSEYAIK